MAMAPDPNTSYDHDENYSCPICFDILQEPYLTECCGQHFCADCIAKVKQRVDRCPYCQTEPLIGITNKNFKRHLRKMYGKYCMIYVYFAWADQRDKVCFIFHKVQGCCVEEKVVMKLICLLFLLHSAFQKMIIAFLRTSITL